MASYLLIESRDPYQHTDSNSFYQIAADLAKAGNRVTFFLVQNGVLPARRGASKNPIAKLRRQAPQVNILVDDFSLQERAISNDRLVGGVSTAPIGTLVDLLADPGTKAIWH